MTFSSVCGLMWSVWSAGRQYDKDGVLEQWWTSNVSASFNEKARCFVNQYSNYTANGEHVRNISSFVSVLQTEFCCQIWNYPTISRSKIASCDEQWSPKDPALLLMSITRTATRSCRTRKRAFHFCLPGVVRRRHAAALHVRPGAADAAAGCCCRHRCCCCCC